MENTDKHSLYEYYYQPDVMEFYRKMGLRNEQWVLTGQGWEKYTMLIGPKDTDTAKNHELRRGFGKPFFVTDDVNTRRYSYHPDKNEYIFYIGEKEFNTTKEHLQEIAMEQIEKTKLQHSAFFDRAATAPDEDVITR